MREVRAALAAGLIWLLGAWLLAYPHLPPAREATGIYGSLLALRGVATGVGVFVVLAFAAYIAGSVSLTLTEGFAIWWRGFGRSYTRPLLNHLPWARTAVGGMNPLLIVQEHAGHSFREFDSFVDAVQHALDEEDTKLSDEVGIHLRDLFKGTPSRVFEQTHAPAAALRDYRTGRSQDESDDYARVPYTQMTSNSAIYFLLRPLGFGVIADLPRIKQQLIRTEPELFAHIDRLDGEAKLRFGLVFPLLGLAGAVAVRTGHWWGALLVVVGALVVVWALTIAGKFSAAEANDSVFEAVLNDQVKAPSLERFAADMSRIRARLVLDRAVTGEMPDDATAPAASK